MRISDLRNKLLDWLGTLPQHEESVHTFGAAILKHAEREYGETVDNPVAFAHKKD